MTDQPIKFSRRRLLGGLITVAGGSAASGAGTMAYFYDTETSSDNTISAGTLELDFDGSGAFEFNTALAPTQTTEESIILVNNGSINGSLDVDVSYKESDGDNNDPEENVSALAVAENLEVVRLDYGDTNLLTEDQNLSGTPTLHELSENDQTEGESTGNDLVDLPDPSNSTSDGTEFTVRLRLKDVDDNFQSDGVSITFDFHLNQNDGQ